MEQKHKKHLQVTCAIIERDGLVLAARRSESMNMPHKWEFPGGKIQQSETKEACLEREIMEELGIVVSIVKPFPPNTHEYPETTVTLYPFLCRIESGVISLSEHSEVAWLTPDELLTFDWAEADIPIAENYILELKRTALQ
jgi:8-oxo-dGTP diphosphatase